MYVLLKLDICLFKGCIGTDPEGKLKPDDVDEARGETISRFKNTNNRSGRKRRRRVEG